MIILVTGAGGFVGPHLVKVLGRAGHKVFGIDRKGVPIYTLPTSQIRPVDILDRKSLDKLMDSIKPDAIVHLAGWSHVGKSWDSPADVFQANVVGAVNLYDSATRHCAGKATRFLFVSSSDVFGSPKLEELPLNEKSPPAPDSPYAVSKYATELALRALRVKSDVELLIVRPFNHIGPGQSPMFACPSFARQIAEMELGLRDVLYHGNLVARRDFLDVRDVAMAYRLVLEKGKDGDLYVLASGKTVTIEWVVQRLFKLAGMAPAMASDPSLMRPHDSKERRGNSSLLKRRTGWKPTYPLDQTLRDILEEARARLKRTTS